MHINQIYRWCLIPRSYELLELHVHLLIGLFFPSLIHIMICTWMCVHTFHLIISNQLWLLFYVDVEFCLDFAWNSKMLRNLPMFEPYWPSEFSSAGQSCVRRSDPRVWLVPGSHPPLCMSPYDPPPRWRETDNTHYDAN